MKMYASLKGSHRMEPRNLTNRLNNDGGKVMSGIDKKIYV